MSTPSGSPWVSDGLSGAQLDAARAMVLAAGLGALSHSTPIAGGANNRAFLVEAGGKKYFLKAYFQDPGDTRNRLAAEYGFSKFAWENGVRCIPEPIAQDVGAGLGLFAYAPGRTLEGNEINPGHVEQALNFWRQVNLARETVQAQRLGPGSEACFSIRQHLECVQRRLARLSGLSTETAIDGEAAGFVEASLKPAWESVRGRTVSAAEKLGFGLDEPVTQAERCLSPSDFGFHNALIKRDGELVFCDFEYAGWDDPAKVACDFFCQPRIPAPAEMFETFTQALILALGLSARHADRVGALLDVYRVKWCCIMLNDFLPVGARRREFAGQTGDAVARKTNQLQKARAMLALI